MGCDLTGQTAFVTGASSGLGVEFARALARQGAKVVLAARRTERLEALAHDIAAEGGQAMPVTLDVADTDAIEAVLDAVEARFGKVTILINNAGTADGHRALDLPLDELDRVWSVNVRGPWALSCAIARRLVASGQEGRIVNIASIAAYVFDGRAIPATFYSVSKAALVRMTEVLAMEWAAHRINVNAIAPGMFESELTAAHLERSLDRALQATPRKRIGHPRQLISTLLYLVDPASEVVTGTCIKADDGQMLR
jgi:NAD(P)-dependent dehydrogenase (short-subunit alcohol dehydrogenase family)